MKYIIYKIVHPEILDGLIQERYCSPRIVYRDVLEELNVTGVKKEHSSIDDAVNEIHNNKEKLQGLRLTILPVISMI